MAIKAEGIFPCTAISATAGENDKKQPIVQINVRIDDGPSKGQLCTYEDEVNAKSSVYIMRSARAVGWKGTDLKTLKADCAKRIAETGGSTTVEIKHLAIKNGPNAGSTWDKVNSIGRGSKPLSELKGSTLDDANEAMRQAADAMGDDIPFATCSLSAEPSAIAKVLR